MRYFYSLLTLVIIAVYQLDSPFAAQRIISFAGLDWNVKSGHQGPGPNYWSDDVQSVWVDDSNQLHLKVRNIDGTWHCAEVYTCNPTKYGIHRFYVVGAVDDLDRNLTFATFFYRNDENEIDIEFAKWGQTDPANNAQYVVQPWTNSGNIHHFNAQLNGIYTTQYIDWQQSSVRFKSIYGHYQEPPVPDSLIHTWEYTGDDIPSQNLDLAIHINLWLFNGNVPAEGQETEVVVANVEAPTSVKVISSFASESNSFAHDFSAPFNPTGIVTAIGQQALSFKVFDVSGRQIGIQPAQGKIGIPSSRIAVVWRIERTGDATKRVVKKVVVIQ